MLFLLLGCSLGGGNGTLGGGTSRQRNWTSGKVEHEGPWTRLWGLPGSCLVLTYHSPFPTPQTHALRLCCDWCFQTSHLPWPLHISNPRRGQAALCLPGSQPFWALLLVHLPNPEGPSVFWLLRGGWWGSGELYFLINKMFSEMGLSFLLANEI